MSRSCSCLVDEYHAAAGRLPCQCNFMSSPCAASRQIPVRNLSLDNGFVNEQDVASTWQIIANTMSIGRSLRFATSSDCRNFTCSVQFAETPCRKVHARQYIIDATKWCHWCASGRS